MARSNAASLTAIARRVAERRGRVHVLLVEHPTLTTDKIADLLDVDRSTIRRDRAALLWAFNKANAGPRVSFKSCAEALGLPGNSKEEENVRKRSAKYREAAGKFLVEVWLVEALKIVTNLTLRAAEATHNFRVELAARFPATLHAARRPVRDVRRHPNPPR